MLLLRFRSIDRCGSTPFPAVLPAGRASAGPVRRAASYALPDHRGFTLVELLVAIVILAIGVLAMAGGSLVVTRDIGLARATADAVSLGQAKVDQIRTLAAASVPPCGSAQFVGSPSPVASGSSSLSWTITGTGAERLVRVVVEYSWLGRPRADTITTLVSC